MNADAESMHGFALARLQRWMQAVITHPGGIGFGVASVAAQQTIAVDTKTLETVVAPSATLSGAERLAIYCRSYHARLLQCFQEMFPALLHALGETLFNQFALDYLQQHPPHSYTLDHLADDFAQHLAETRPDADAPAAKRESWPDFIIELAALEWAFLQIYNGPGVEERTVARAEALLMLAPEQVLDALPSPVPCLRLFAFRYPVHAYMLAVRRGAHPELPAPAETFVGATRTNYRVMLYELSAPQYACLKALDGQHTVSQAFNQALSDSQPQPGVTIQSWLCDWASKGFLEAI
jgi:hypothetical protein